MPHEPSDDPLVAEYFQASRADNTRKAYDADLRHFQTWGGHLPSSPDEVARYLAHHACILLPVTLRRRLAALATVHKNLGLADPTKHVLVHRAIQGIEHRHSHAPKQVAPLPIDDLTKIIAHMGRSPEDLRDKAVRLVGFFGAFRRSELVALDTADIAFTDNSLAITIRKSKTDQLGRDRTVHLPRRDDILCPAAAVRDWTGAVEISEGAVFRTIDGRQRLCTSAVAWIIKEHVAEIGLDARRFSGHSLRADFATSAALAGYDATHIARQTGHKSQQMVAAYVRPTVIITSTKKSAR